jgi:hypothetical protein
MAKAAGNGYSPSPKATAPRFYSTNSWRWKNTLLQLATDAHHSMVRVISGRNFLFLCSPRYSFLVIRYAPAVKTDISMVHFNARQLAWSRLYAVVSLVESPL